MSLHDIFARWSDDVAEFFAENRAVVLGLFDVHGQCIYSNSALRNLLGKDDICDLQSDYLVSPSWSRLVRSLNTDGVIYEGWLTFEGPQLESRSVRGQILRQDDWLLLLATYDVDELERINQELFSTNKEVTRLQRELARKNAALQKRTDELARVNQALQINIAERERTEAALWKSETRYRIMSELSSDYAYSISVHADGRQVRDWVSDGFTQITGYTLTELSEHEDWQKLIHPDDMAAVKERVDKLYSGQEVDTEFRIITKAGETRWLHDFARPVWDAQEQRVVRVYGAAQDITVRKQAEADKNQLALEQAKARLLQSFVEDVSHEFRTPLTVIHSSLELLEMTVSQMEVRAAKRIDRIKQETMYISDLVNAMMTMTKLDSISSLPLVAIEINALVGDIVENYQSQATEHSVVLNLESVKPTPVVSGAPDRLHLAIENIVDNAIRFTPPQGHVTLRTSVERQYAIVEVSDTGVGISDEALPLIFDRFYRSDTARTGRQTGLGLSIAHRIVELHRGQIQVTSQIDVGSTFRILLPLADGNMT